MMPSQNHVDQEYSIKDTLTGSNLYRLLWNERRRIALEVLLNRSAPVDLEELAVAVTQREEGLHPTDEEDLERVKTTLHHAHLPMIADAEIIEYDPSSSRVTVCPSESYLFLG